jgi:hypothetical protein
MSWLCRPGMRRSPKWAVWFRSCSNNLPGARKCWLRHAQRASNFAWQRMQNVGARRKWRLTTTQNARVWRSALRLRSADLMQRWIVCAKNRSGWRSNWRAKPGNLQSSCRLRWRRLGSWRPSWRHCRQRKQVWSKICKPPGTRRRTCNQNLSSAARKCSPSSTNFAIDCRRSRLAIQWGPK